MHLTASVCPLQLRNSCLPLAASQIVIVVSLLPQAINLPSGEKETQVTASVWPLRVCKIFSLETSQTLIV